MPQTLEEIEKGIKEVREQIPAIQAGVSALTEIDTTLAPPVDTNAGDISATATGLTAADAQMQELIKTLTKQSEEAAKRAATAQKGILGMITKRAEAREAMPSQEELMRTTLAEYGLTPESVQKVQGLMGQLTSYNQQIATLEANKQAALAQIEQKPILQGIIDLEKARQTKVYNLEISAKAAQAGVVAQQIQMERGLWTDARATAGMIVSAATWDVQQQLADLDWAMDTYQDLYNMATGEEQTAWDRAYTLAKDELDKQQTDMTNKLDIWRRAAEAGIDMGWSYQDIKDRTLEELTKDYTEKVAVVPDVTTQIIKTEAGAYLNIVTDRKTGKVIRTEPISGAGAAAAGIILSDEDWANAIKMGADKLSSIDDPAQYSRVLKLLTSRELGLEDDKERITVMLEKKVKTLEEIINDTWNSYFAGDITEEEANTLITFVSNEDIRITQEETAVKVKITEEEFIKSTWETVSKIPGIAGKGLKWMFYTRPKELYRMIFK